MSPIKNFECPYSLGMPSMDSTHQEFVDLVNQLYACDNEAFAGLFPQLQEHTKTHFAAEARLMEESDFPAIVAHKAEHARLLGEMAQFADQLRDGRIDMARAYVIEQLPRWFKLHLITMDNALAAHLSGVGVKTSRQ